MGFIVTVSPKKAGTIGSPIVGILGTVIGVNVISFFLANTFKKVV